MKNQIKTVVLLTLLAVLLMFIGRLIGGFNGLMIGLVFAIGINFISYWFSDKIVLKLYKAKEASLSEYRDLHQLVESLAVRAKIPKPKVYILPTPQMNAFASGRSPRHAVVAVTQGLLDNLNRQELEGVLGHELSHIQNYDILIASVAAAIAAVISFVAMMARWTAIFGGFGGRDGEGGNNLVELLALAILAPFMAMIIQFAISRSREYLADEKSVRLTHNPSGMISALQKIHENVRSHPLRRMGTTEATSHLFIESPFSGRSFLELFSTHPTVEKRIQRLRSLRF